MVGACSRQVIVEEIRERRMTGAPGSWRGMDSGSGDVVAGTFGCVGFAGIDDIWGTGVSHALPDDQAVFAWKAWTIWL